MQKDKRLDFVLRYYEEGRLDTRQALRRLSPPRPRATLRRLVAAAASLTALVALAIGFTVYLRQPVLQPQQPATQQSAQPAATARPATLHFDNTPLPEVLHTLGQHYGVQLQADHTDKRLTGDFEADSLDHTISMIEQVLSVRITRQ